MTISGILSTEKSFFLFYKNRTIRRLIRKRQGGGIWARMVKSFRCRILWRKEKKLEWFWPTLFPNISNLEQLRMVPEKFVLNINYIRNLHDNLINCNLMGHIWLTIWFILRRKSGKYNQFLFFALNLNFDRFMPEIYRHASNSKQGWSEYFWKISQHSYTKKNPKKWRARALIWLSWPSKHDTNDSFENFNTKQTLYLLIIRRKDLPTSYWQNEIIKSDL